MTQEEKTDNSDKIHKGVVPPPNINPVVLAGGGRKKKKRYSVEEYVNGIVAGDRTILSQAITLAESSLPGHYRMAQEIIEKCLPLSGRSVRIGITGSPGVGKSTFIEAFGLQLAGEGRRLAVLAIDPSSGKTGGSILGDKTRMEKLSTHPNAFIRPSPSAGTLGGVARKTRESIIMCEAAGFDTIIVETVGVGQSETAVRAMVDFFLLLLLAGAGDELQGIKRGIMEMADAVAITKADGSNKLSAESARAVYNNALGLFPPGRSAWRPAVVTCSARMNTGISEIWNIIRNYADITKQSGYFDLIRKEQAVKRMHNMISENLKTSFYSNAHVAGMLEAIEKNLYDGTITSYKAAKILLDSYFSSKSR